MIGFDRAMAWTAEEEPERGRMRLRVFSVVFAVHLAAEHANFALNLLRNPPPLALSVLLGASWLLAGAAAAGFRPRAAFAGLAALQFFYLQNNWPVTGNHVYLEFYVALALAIFNIDEAGERGLLLGLLRWAVIVVLFYSGLQKLVHGYFFRGEMFAYLIVRNDRFRQALEFVLPAAEFARIAAFKFEPGEGLYRIRSAPALLLSNGAYLMELCIPALLLARRTRAAGAALALVFLFFVELAAREFFFGLLFYNLILLFLPARVHRGAAPAFAAAYALLLVWRLQLFPGFRGPDFS